MAARRRRNTIRRSSVPRQRSVRRRRNPARNNPSGIGGIVMSGVWVGVGMWAGGLIGGFIPRFGSGIVGDALHGLITAYGVAWVGARFTRNAGLMAAGAFAPVAMSLLSGVMGGAGSLVSGLTSSIGGAVGGSVAPQQVAAGSNVVQMPAQQAA